MITKWYNLLTGSTTTLLEIATTANREDNDIFHKSKSDIHEILIDRKSNESSSNKTNPNNNESSTEQSKNSYSFSK